MSDAITKAVEALESAKMFCPASGEITLALIEKAHVALKQLMENGGWRLVSLPVRNEPPALPSFGDIFIVGNEPRGDFAGRAGKLAFYAAMWRFGTLPPPPPNNEGEA